MGLFKKDNFYVGLNLNCCEFFNFLLVTDFPRVNSNFCPRKLSPVSAVRKVHWKMCCIWQSGNLELPVSLGHRRTVCVEINSKLCERKTYNHSFSGTSRQISQLGEALSNFSTRAISSRSLKISPLHILPSESGLCRNLHFRIRFFSHISTPLFVSCADKWLSVYRHHSSLL